MARTRSASKSGPKNHKPRSAKLSFHHQQSRLQLDAVPEVLQPDVLVSAVLIVVVIDDWNLDRVRSQYVDDHVEGDASTGGGLQNDRVSYAARRRNELLRGRQVHGRTDRVVAARVDDDLRDPRICEARLFIRVGTYDLIALLANMLNDARHLS